VLLVTRFAAQRAGTGAAAVDPARHLVPRLIPRLRIGLILGGAEAAQFMVASGVLL
jgi:hypothetical protein